MSNIYEHELEPVESWDKARTMSKGFQVSELVESLLKNFKFYVESRDNGRRFEETDLTIRRAHLLTAWSYVFPRTLSEDVTVCDIGGGNGYMFDWIANHHGFAANVDLEKLNLKQKLSWTVYESSGIAHGYQQNKGNLPINFLENKPENFPEKIDLVIMSCFIQYVDEWDEILEFIGKRSEFLLLMRLPLIPSDKHLVYVQHLFGGVYGKTQSSWPIRFFSEYEFLTKIKENFQVIFTGKDMEETIPFAGQDQPVRTLLLRRKAISQRV